MNRLLGGVCLIVALCIGMSSVGCGKKNKTSTTTPGPKATMPKGDTTHKETEKDTAKETTKETVKETPKETPKETKKETKKETTKDTTKEEESYLRPARRDVLFAALTGARIPSALPPTRRLEAAGREHLGG